MRTLSPESGLRTALNWLKIQKTTMTSQFSDMTSLTWWHHFFDVVLFPLSSLLVQVSCQHHHWFWNSGNPEIGSSLVWIFPNIWRLGQVMDTKFGTNVSNRMLLNVAKCQRYSFYRFWINKGKPTGTVKTTPPTQINK